MKKNIGVLGTAAFALLSLALLPAVLVADDDLPLNMRANAGVQTRGQTTMMDISVTEWTTSEEREMLIQFMKEEGTDNLADKMRDLSAKGRINPRAQMGINWRYAYQFVKDGGRTIVLASERPLNVDQAFAPTAAERAHSITMAVIELDDEGNGAGTLILGAALAFGADGKLEVTQAGQNAVHLGNVRVLN